MLKKFFNIGLKIGVSVALIWFATRQLDFATAVERFSAMSIGWIIWAPIIFVIVMINNTIRWHVVMSGIGSALPFLATFRILYIGMFFNQVLPSSVGGDAVRMFLVYKSGLGVRIAVNGILLERAATLLGLIILVVITQPLLLDRIGDNPAKFAFPLLAAVAVAGIAVLMLLDKVPDGLKRWKVVRGLGTLAEDTRQFFLRLRYSLPAILMGIIGFAFLSLIAWVMARSLGIEISVIDCMVLIPPVMLITTIPISVAGWGVRETAMVFALGFVGVEPTDAVILSLLMGILIFVASVPGAIVWLKSGYRRSDVTEDLPAN